MRKDVKNSTVAQQRDFESWFGFEAMCGIGVFEFGVEQCEADLGFGAM